LVKQSAILLPMVVLAIWTMLVLLLVPYRRTKAALARQVKVNDFKFGESAAVPPDVSIPNRNLMNLLEMPVLFYAACISFYITQLATPTVLALAWMFVGLRLVHSLIHLSYNMVLHRLAAFATSNLVLLVMWLMLGAGL
jgi:hypothetical protein